MSNASLSLLTSAGVEPYQAKEDEEYMNEDQLLHFKRFYKHGMSKFVRKPRVQ